MAVQLNFPKKIVVAGYPWKCCLKHEITPKNPVLSEIDELNHLHRPSSPFRIRFRGTRRWGHRTEYGNYTGVYGSLAEVRPN